MTTILADTFRVAPTRLTNDEQKLVKQTVYDLQDDQTQPGLGIHRWTRRAAPRLVGAGGAGNPDGPAEVGRAFRERKLKVFRMSLALLLQTLRERSTCPIRRGP